MKLIDPNAPTDKPETAQMVVIHKALRREFGLLPELVNAVAPGDTSRASSLAGHARILFAILHEHHDSEDRLLWPVLQQRAPLREALIATMETQHQAVADLSGLVDKDLGPWSETAGAPARDRLAKNLVRLRDALNEHLDLEEGSVLPLIHDHVTVADWLAAQKAASASMPPGLRTPMLMAGVVLEDATARERAWFIQEMPPPARPLWHLLGRRIYAAHVRKVRPHLGA